MSAPDPRLSALLYEALAAPIGLLCSAEPDLETARQRLYSTRHKLGDPDLAALQFRASPFPDEGNLVITKQTIQLPANQQPTVSQEPIEDAP